MGLISRVDALRELNPEIDSDEDAIDRLLRIERLGVIIATGGAALSGGSTTDSADAPEAGADPAVSIAPEGESLASTALNGAQIASLLSILGNVAAGSVTNDAALAIIAAAFPTIAEGTARRILAGAIPIPQGSE